jgi:hypothetical protein
VGIFRRLEAGGILRKIFNFIFVIISGQLAEPFKKLAPLTLTELLRGLDIPPSPKHLLKWDSFG